jgi:hypothetical protein
MKMTGGDISPVRKTGRGQSSPALDPLFDPRRVRVSFRVRVSSDSRFVPFFSFF